VPEYISSDSSLEAEDATPEQRTNHQLRLSGIALGVPLNNGGNLT
jgi:hypothetical protein